MPRLRAIVAAALLAAALYAALPTAASASAQPASNGPDHAAFARIITACQGKDSFSTPAPPARIFGNVWYVGTCNVTALLVTSPSGHVLIDAATDEAAPAILANIRALGFREGDVRWILLSHEHLDHVGGLAQIVRATGSRVIARAAAVPALASGTVDPADPQAQGIAGFAPVRVARVVRDGQTVTLSGLRFTATAAPGHTAGGTSWHWRACAGGQCQRFDYVDSLSAIALGTYRIGDHPELVATFRHTIAAVAARPCGVLLTPHPFSSDMFPRFAGIKPFTAPDACRTYAAAGTQRLDALLAAEIAAPRK